MKKVVALLVGLVLMGSAVAQTWQRIGKTPTDASSGGICSTVGQYGTDGFGTPYVCKLQADLSGKWVAVGGGKIPEGTQIQCSGTSPYGQTFYGYARILAGRLQTRTQVNSVSQPCDTGWINGSKSSCTACSSCLFAFIGTTEANIAGIQTFFQDVSMGSCFAQWP